MAKAAVVILAVVAFTLAQSLSVSGPSGNYTAVVANHTLVIDGQQITLPKVRLSWYYNESYTVFGIYYSNPADCQLGTYPNAPKFYIQCTTGTDIVVVAVKDPKARVICRERNNVLTPQQAMENVEVYTTKSLDVECEATFSAVVSTPTVLIGALAGLTAASAVLVLALGVMLLRRALFK
jgi:hypothetical protein